MRRAILLVGLLIATALFSYAQQKAVVAVIPFQASGISEAEAHGLTELFEGALQKTGRFTVIEQTRMEAVLKAQEASLADCTDEACAVEIGKLLAAEQIVLGTAGKIGQRYYLAVKLIDVAKGTNINAQDEQRSSLDGVVDNLYGLAGRLSGSNDPQPSRATVEASTSSAGVPAPKPTNGFVEMVSVDGGTFQMGDTWDEGELDEKPVHSVTLTSYLIGKCEVTQAQYYSVTGADPSYFTGDTARPVEMVSWYDAVEFCNLLSALESVEQVYTIDGTTVTANWSRNGYRLPTEAEWEYAAKGGKSSRGYLYVGGQQRRRRGMVRGEHAGVLPAGRDAAGGAQEGERAWPVRHERERSRVVLGLYRLGLRGVPKGARGPAEWSMFGSPRPGAFE